MYAVTSGLSNSYVQCRFLKLQLLVYLSASEYTSGLQKGDGVCEEVLNDLDQFESSTILVTSAAPLYTHQLIPRRQH